MKTKKNTNDNYDLKMNWNTCFVLDDLMNIRFQACRIIYKQQLLAVMDLVP